MNGWRSALDAARGALRELMLLALFAGLVAGCRSSSVEPIPESTSVFDTLPKAERRQFDLARADMDADRMDAAVPTLARLRREHPDNIYVGLWLQEAELAQGAEHAPVATHDTSAAQRTGAAAQSAGVAAQSAGAAAQGAPSSSEDPFQEQLRARYREQAEQAPTVANLVLAARLEPDPLAATLLLERAAALAPDCAWCAYGRAFIAARGNQWPDVQAWIARAKKADPAHLPTRWLECWLLARAGSVEQAIGAFEVWIAKASDDRRLDRRLLLEARIDLALLWVLDEQPERAQKTLDEIGDSAGIDQGRRLSIGASADQALDKSSEALAAAMRAEELSPGEILPLVQQAMLQELWLNDPQAAEASWARVLERSRASSDLAALLGRMRARVHLERFQVQREKQAARAAAHKH